jgi:integrase
MAVGRTGSAELLPAVPPAPSFTSLLLRETVPRVRWPAICHELWHPFATHWLADACDIRPIQEFLGNTDVKITMISTYALNRGRGSPLDEEEARAFAATPSTGGQGSDRT